MKTHRIGCALALAAIVACDRRPQLTAVPALHFEDVTATSGIAFTTTSGKTPSSQILEVKGGGLATLDYDDDGDFDLFVPNGATLESPRKGPGARFYVNSSTLAAIRFEDATAQSGITFDRWGFGPCVLDGDGDGKDDLFVACFGEDAFFRNRGGSFEDATAQAGLTGDANDWSTAAATGDLDLDGDLDLYVANYLEIDPANPPPPSVFLAVRVFSGPNGLRPLPDRCYLNRGDGTFEDASERLGFRAVEPGYGLGVAILDLDADGSQDVFVGNDSGRNFHFVREADGRFRDIASESGLATNGDGIEQATMGITIGDVNGDTLPDVFSTNFMNDTNTLQVNLGARQFSDQTALYGLGVVSRPYVAWATAFVDFDHDLDEDLLVFNGHVYPKEITEPNKWGHDQAPQLMRRAGKRFELVTAKEGGAWLGQAHCDRSAVFDDFDRDGDIDVIVNGLNQPIRVLENDSTLGGPSVLVELRQGAAFGKNPHALGSRVVLTAGDTKQTRWIYSSGGYQSTQPPRAHFALPRETKSFTLDVTWPDGTTATYPQEKVSDRLRLERRSN
jgi:enediyne biosynthesis protein E4